MAQHYQTVATSALAMFYFVVNGTWYSDPFRTAAATHDAVSVLLQ
jgi:hypothetical protein